MKHVRILFHALLALLPVLVAREFLRLSEVIEELFHSSVGPMSILVLALAAVAFFPLMMVADARRLHPSSGVPPAPIPPHPTGWITVMGAFGHIPALWAACRLNADPYSVSFSFLGPPLILASFVLSRRYVERLDRLSPPAPKPVVVDQLDPPSDEI
jgi:hypothetical protein